MRLTYLMTCAALAGALAGCDMTAPIQSQHMPKGGIPASAISGVMYALPLSRLRIVVANDSGGNPVMTVSRVNYADPAARYIATAALSDFAKDKIEIGTDGAGLLNLAKATTDEVTDTIVEQAATGLSELIAAPATLATTKSASGGGVPLVNELIDPYAHKNKKAGISLAWPGGVPKLGKGQSRQACPKGTSICIPVMVPVEVTLHHASGDIKQMIAVPDPRSSIGIRMHRRPCVSTINTLTVDQGIMTRFDIDKPSEVAGCLSIPLDVLTAIISAPVNAVRSETASLAAQKALVEAQLALVTAQTNLANAQQTANGDGGD